jgi:hypothetical protein
MEANLDLAPVDGVGGYLHPRHDVVMEPAEGDQGDGLGGPSEVEERPPAREDEADDEGEDLVYESPDPS